MDIKSKILEYATTLINDNKFLIDSSNESINVKNFEQREALIGELSDLAQTWVGVQAQIDEFLSQLNAIQFTELNVINSLLKSKAKTKKKYDWLVVASKRKQATRTPVATAVSPAVAPNERMVPITETISLPALVVSTFNEVKNDGKLYYVDTADHFAIMIAGKLFHGNVGTIYTEEKNPEKIKDCKFSTSCVKQTTCDYYHNPRHFTNSRDRRNFIASSWLYAPPTSFYKNRPRSRRFGSLVHLDEDLAALQAEEVSRFCDQTMHDILCALILKYNFD